MHVSVAQKFSYQITRREFSSNVYALHFLCQVMIERYLPRQKTRAVESSIKCKGVNTTIFTFLLQNNGIRLKQKRVTAVPPNPQRPTSCLILKKGGLSYFYCLFFFCLTWACLQSFQIWKASLALGGCMCVAIKGHIPASVLALCLVRGVALSLCGVLFAPAGRRNLFASVQPMHLEGRAVEMGWPPWPSDQKGTQWGVPEGGASDTGLRQGCSLQWICFNGFLGVFTDCGKDDCVLAQASVAWMTPSWPLLQGESQRQKTDGRLRGRTKALGGLITWVTTVLTHVHRSHGRGSSLLHTGSLYTKSLALFTCRKLFKLLCLASFVGRESCPYMLLWNLYPPWKEGD